MGSSVRMLAFAGAREILGAGELAFDVATPCTTDELLGRVCERFPALTPYRASLRVAVNGSYAAASDPVVAGDEVALIPPVAGG